MVFLVRHAVAEDDHPLGDEARPLSRQGRADFRAHARRIARKARLKGVVTSPLVRAVQTAEILAEAAGLDQVLVRRELDPSHAGHAAIAALAREVGDGWALVGHNPSMAEALARMLGLGAGAVRFRKGAVAAIRSTGQGGRPWKMLWMAAPGRRTKREVKLAGPSTAAETKPHAPSGRSK